MTEYLMHKHYYILRYSYTINGKIKTEKQKFQNWILDMVNLL